MCLILPQNPGVLGQEGQSSDFCVMSLGTSQGGIQIKGNSLSLNIASDQAGVTLDELDGAVGFTVVDDNVCTSTRCKHYSRSSWFHINHFFLLFFH